jgi:hypothetical protein
MEAGTRMGPPPLRAAGIFANVRADLRHPLERNRF